MLTTYEKISKEQGFHAKRTLKTQEIEMKLFLSF